MKKIIIIKNKKTGKITVKIARIQDIDIINGIVILEINNRLSFIYLSESDYVIQRYTHNNLIVFYEHYALKKDKYF